MERKDFGYIIEGTRGYLHILFYGSHIVRFVYSDQKEAPPSTMAVIQTPKKAVASSEHDILKTEKLSINVDRETLSVRISDQYDHTISEDLSIAFNEKRIEKKRLWEIGIYGNGEKYSWLNQLGVKTSNYNSDVLRHATIHNPMVEQMHTAIPFYIGVAPGQAYGIYLDNSYRTSFDFAASNREKISFQAEGGFLDYYFIYGPTVDEVIKNYSFLTGTPPMPRKKFLGYHQSRYSYETEDELLAVAESLIKHKIPCDVLYVDIAYMDAYKVFTISEKRYKNFKATLQKLKSMGFAVVVIVNPGVKVERGYHVYEEGRQKGYFVTKPGGDIYQGEVWPKPAVFPDFLRSEVRQWWGGLHRELLAQGVDAIWNDMNEPADFTQKSATLPEDTVHRSDDGKEVSHAEVHNIYGLLQTRATRGALETIEPNKRAFVLTRAGFAGTQRYAALWTGDNASVWEHMECSIPMVTNLGLSGLAFTGADVGGYQGDCSGELLVRWTQLGAFLPYFRNHSEIGTVRQEPWEFNDEVLDITREYIRLRYCLLTYWYNLMRESTLTGVPAVRPLFYHHQDDLKTYNINDQFLFGEGVMVCPVLRPGVNHRMVYLPSGLWHDYWTGETHVGGRYITRETPLDILPLYIKAGTILPHDRLISAPGYEQTGGAIDMHCYAGDNGFYRLYIDDGVTNNYLQGEYSELEFFLEDDPVQPLVKEKITKKGFPLPEINYKIHLKDCR